MGADKTKYNLIILEEKRYFEVIMRAARALREGKIVAVPTDTVYGLAADATNNTAIERLFHIKEREEERPVPIFVDTMERAKHAAFIEEKKLEETLKHYWPGALTAILYARGVASPLVRGRGGLTIGLRIPDFRFLRDLIRAFGKPITGTSANRSGSKPATSVQGVIDAFDGAALLPDMIIDGGVCAGMPSTVVDFTVVPPKVLREGATPSLISLFKVN